MALGTVNSMPVFYRYLPLIIVFMVSIVLACAQFDIVANIWHFSFDDGTYSHAYLIPFISAYLYYELFKEGALTLTEKINYFAVILTLLLAFILVLFTIAQFTTGYRLFFILFYTSLISLVLKPSFKVIFPSLFLVFLLPIWGILTPYLQALSTSAVTSIMQLTGIPTFVEGNFISIPAGVFEIAGGCSGLRYLLVSLSVSSLFIFLNIKNAKDGMVFFTVAVLGALITNWLRITLLILIGHYTEMESELMNDHNAFGWYLYIPFLVFLFYFGQRYITNPSQKQALIHSQKLPVKSVILVLVIIVISSRTLINSAVIKNTKTTDSSCITNTAGLPLPQIFSVYDLCIERNSTSATLMYSFKGSELGESADFYLNKFVPKNATNITSTIEGEWSVLSFTHEKKQRIVKYQFQSGSAKAASTASLKKAKILSAFSGIQETKLIWKVITL